MIHESRSIDGTPTIDVTFDDGYTDTLILDHYYFSDEDRLIRSENCDFIGHLANDQTACVAVTGCIGSEEVDITIMGDRGGLYQIGLTGNVSAVEVDDLEIAPEDRKKKKKLDDGLDSGSNTQFDYCEKIDCPDMPPTGVLDIQVKPFNYTRAL